MTEERYGVITHEQVAAQREAEKRQAAEALLQQLASLSGQSPDVALAVLTNDKVAKTLSTLVGPSKELQAIKARVWKLSTSTDPVLITGPSGVGKEILAQALHGSKDPADFYAINCAGMPELLIESELFGHVAGAFTGAVREHPGIFRRANEGTVFLDEIGEAPATLQAKLLRALQPDAQGRYTIRPVGATVGYSVKFRFIAATNRDLFAEAKQGTFRLDLYGRLMAHEIYVPPLSQRPEDITAILVHLGLTNEEIENILDDPYWTERIELLNVRALQAAARRTIQARQND